MSHAARETPAPAPPGPLADLLRSLEPVLHEGVYAYSSAPLGAALGDLQVVGTFREAEGLTLIAREDAVRRAGFPVLFRAAWITLTVDSALEAVGLTAAFATALGAAGISCNVVAGAHHDHLFVPVEKRDEAMEVLRALQRGAG